VITYDSQVLMYSATEIFFFLKLFLVVQPIVR
jgi:hypothetical protein